MLPATIDNQAYLQAQINYIDAHTSVDEIPHSGINLDTLSSLSSLIVNSAKNAFVFWARKCPKCFEWNVEIINPAKPNEWSALPGGGPPARDQKCADYRFDLCPSSQDDIHCGFSAVSLISQGRSTRANSGFGDHDVRGQARQQEPRQR
ncbi:MAG: hypothetical protein M1831_007193 [Alyxoria varia]|nr:MAG: hypothetical protein M1831_007193 [Alyxoria varia]